MAAEDLRSLLELSKQAEKMPQQPTYRTPNSDMSAMTITRDNFDTRIAQLDEMVYGKYQQTEEDRKKFDANKALEEMKNRRIPNDIKVTNPILAEVANNPYEYDVDTYESMVRGSKMAELEEKLMAKNESKKKNALAAAKEITSMLSEMDNKPQINEQKVNYQQSQGGNIDYGMIKMIIESVVEEKLQKYSKTLLTENKTNPKNITMLTLGEDFKFMDSDGNVYKCGTLKYLGKAKKKV